MLRGYFAGSALKIMFDDLPNVDRILQVTIKKNKCSSIQLSKCKLLHFRFFFFNNFMFESIKSESFCVRK